MAAKTREVRFRRLVDLSQEISPDTPMFPAYPAPAFTPWTTREVHGFLAETLFFVSHTGTHVDAPFHFEPTGKKVDELPLDQFLAPGHVLNLPGPAPRASVEAPDLRTARKAAGRPIHPGDAALIRTGWERTRGTPGYLHENPGLGRAAAKELVDWGVSLVGIDSPNLDAAGAVDYPAHHTLLGAGIPVVENVANMAELGTGPFTLVAFPLRLRGTTGSPIRLVALVE